MKKGNSSNKKSLIFLISIVILIIIIGAVYFLTNENNNSRENSKEPILEGSKESALASNDTQEDNLEVVLPIIEVISSEIVYCGEFSGQLDFDIHATGGNDAYFKENPYVKDTLYCMSEGLKTCKNTRTRILRNKIGNIFTIGSFITSNSGDSCILSYEFDEKGVSCNYPLEFLSETYNSYLGYNGSYSNYDANQIYYNGIIVSVSAGDYTPDYFPGYLFQVGFKKILLEYEVEGGINLTPVDKSGKKRTINCNFYEPNEIQTSRIITRPFDPNSEKDTNPNNITPLNRIEIQDIKIKDLNLMTESEETKLRSVTENFKDCISSEFIFIGEDIRRISTSERIEDTCIIKYEKNKNKIQCSFKTFQISSIYNSKLSSGEELKTSRIISSHMDALIEEGISQGEFRNLEIENNNGQIYSISCRGL